jgi:hypothetical protein
MINIADVSEIHSTYVTSATLSTTGLRNNPRIELASYIILRNIYYELKETYNLNSLRPLLQGIIIYREFYL